MKKLTFFAVSIASVAFALSSCGGNNSKIEKNSSDQSGESSTSTASTISANKGDIVFVRIDSIINNYDMYDDLRKVYEEEVKAADTKLRSRGNALQKDMNSLQEKYDKGLITRSQAEEEQERLQRRAQSFEEERGKTANELGEKEAVMLNNIQDAILSYINKYNETKGYAMIISTSGNSTVLYGNPGLDITTDIIEGLNKEYVSSK